MIVCASVYRYMCSNTLIMLLVWALFCLSTADIIKAQLLAHTLLKFCSVINFSSSHHALKWYSKKIHWLDEAQVLQAVCREPQ